MLTEAIAAPSSRYLLCNYYFPDKTIKSIKADVKSFMVDRKKDDLYFEFINWRRRPNEIAVLTMHSYADILLPKRFDKVFQIDNPANHIDTEFGITQAILNGWMSTNEISHGHKHILVIEFPNSIPGIFKLLSAFTGKEANKKIIQLGFCSQPDFDIIKTNLKQQAF